MLAEDRMAERVGNIASQLSLGPKLPAEDVRQTVWAGTLTTVASQCTLGANLSVEDENQLLLLLLGGPTVQIRKQNLM